MESGTTNYIALLNEYAQKTRNTVKYEEVGIEGPDHIRRFTIRAVVCGQAYPAGTGANKKEAKQNAARIALNHLRETENSESQTPLPTQSSGHSAAISQVNFVCWLNEYSHKTKLMFTPVESTRPGQTPYCCKYTSDDKEFPLASGRTKKEAKEAAARLVYEDVQRKQSVQVDENCNGVTLSENSALNGEVTSISGKLQSLHLSSAADYQITIKDKNYIGILNHYCQKMRLVHDFKLVERRGPAHNPEFVYKVVMDKKEYSEGVGKTAKEAKQNAAQLAWSELQEQSDWNSQVSVKSTVSEDESLPTASTIEATDAQSSSKDMTEGTSSSHSIIFKDSSCPEPLKAVVSPVDTKPKRKLAANFQLTPIKMNEGGAFPTSKIPNLVSTVSLSSPSTKSRFKEEFSSIKKIGKGGFGHVFKAKQDLEGKDYAVKIVRWTTKAQREVTALADLQHCNIVRYHTCWIEDTAYKYENSESFSASSSSGNSTTQYLYIQMEFCPGDTLKVWIDTMNVEHRRPNRRSDALHIVQQVLDAVQYIHFKNLIHRDLKPANVLFGKDGEVKVGDFGLVTAADNDHDENLLERTKCTGTRSYMSPEQRNQTTYDRKVDIFALGLIYFELLYNLQTGMEKQKIWADVRSKKFPQRFHSKFCFEHKLIERMLCEDPKDRPEARDLVPELKKCSSILQRERKELRENRTY